MSILMLVPSPPKIPSNFNMIDKVEHFAAFFVLSFLLSIVMMRKNGCVLRSFLLTAVIMSLYGLLIEYFQQFTGRTPELADLFADIAGCIAGSLVALFFL